MAKGNAVWGIDIGQCALKALRCRPHEKEPRRLVVEAFDYVEYPKILTQPEAEPAELIREALGTFLSRNDLSGDTVAMSVSGQSGLARFIKLPPVESKKIPDIVKYEARQQIPFALDDVVWDYQQLTGGSEEDGFALEPEVGLFAMKRDQVAKALAPLEEAGIEVDLIQLAPLAIYNYVCFDRMEDLKDRPYDPANPPVSTVVISIGTDTTDLVVTNGFRVWQRNIPIGGNHFTRALSKELKLTFVKAEHLKRHATQADDPKAVFQAMRPVFSDLLAEIQRSLGYFSSLDKAAKIGEVIALGNAMKLPGLQRYLAQNLEQDVKPIEEFQRLVAGSASGSAAFKENVLSFAPAYGLCIQGLVKSELKTNLLPEEIVTRRMVRSKKPWAVAGVAAVLAGLSVNYFTHVSAWSAVNVKDVSWTSPLGAATAAAGTARTLEDERLAIKAAAETLVGVQKKLTDNVEGRLRWLELMKAIDAALPKDDAPREETAEAVMKRNELHITAIDNQYFADLTAEYFTGVEPLYAVQPKYVPPAPAGAPAMDPLAAAAPVDPLAGGAAAVPTAGPTGTGWVVQLTGHHFHNADMSNDTGRFVVQTLLKNLAEGSVELPDGPNGEMVAVPISDLAITHAWIVKDKSIDPNFMIDPDAELYADGGAPPPMAFSLTDDDEDEDDDKNADVPPGIDPLTGQPITRAFTVRRYDFVVQFCWQPKTRAERQTIAETRAAEQEAASEAAAAAGGVPADGSFPADEAPVDGGFPAEAAPVDAVPPADVPAEGAPVAEPAAGTDLTTTP
jgi:type IV pilus assembly protein PilM